MSIFSRKDGGEELGARDSLIYFALVTITIKITMSRSLNDQLALTLSFCMSPKKKAIRKEMSRYSGEQGKRTAKYIVL